MATPTYEAIFTTTIGSTVSSIDITSIPDTYQDLVLVLAYKNGTMGNMTVNNDTSGAWRFQGFYESGGSSASFSSSGVSHSQLSVSATAANSSDVTIILNIMAYADTDKYKNVIGRAQSDNGIDGFVSTWTNTAKINQINLENTTFQTGSVVTLFGVANS